MKFFAFIMGFYFLYLSSFTCGDSMECNTKATIKISATANHRDHHHEAEMCSPFCTCSCCATAAFHVSYSKLPVSKILIQSGKHPLYDVSFVTEVYGNIWQPPQIS